MMNSVVSRTVSSADEASISSSAHPSQMLPKRTHYVQDQHGQTVYMPSTDPVSADVSPSSVTVNRGATNIAPPTFQSGSSSDQRVSSGAMTVSAPPGVDVQHDEGSRTFTLTFGVDGGAPDSATTTTTKISTAQLLWQPPGATANQRPDVDRAPADDVSAAARPPPLARIVSESTEEPPDTPTSPDSRKSQYQLLLLFIL